MFCSNGIKKKCTSSFGSDAFLLRLRFLFFQFMVYESLVFLKDPEGIAKAPIVVETLQVSKTNRSKSPTGATSKTPMTWMDNQWTMNEETWTIKPRTSIKPLVVDLGFWALTGSFELFRHNFFS